MNGELEIKIQVVAKALSNRVFTSKSGSLTFEYTESNVIKTGKVWTKIVSTRYRKVLKDGVLQSTSTESSGTVCFINNATGSVHKPQGMQPAKTPRYYLLDNVSFDHLLRNSASDQFGGWLYQEFKDVA